MDQEFRLVRWETDIDGELNVENFELKLKNLYNYEYSNCLFNSGYILGKHSYDEDKVNGIFSGFAKLTLFIENNQKHNIELTDGDILFFPMGTVLSYEFNTDCDFYFSV